MTRSVAAILFAAVLCAADSNWVPLFNGTNLDGWEPRGPCLWSVMEGGVLLGQRVHSDAAKPFAEPWPVVEKQYQGWLYRQAWLYTQREYGEFDLHLEYWIPPGVNSGVSIRDRSRAHTAIGEADTDRPELAAFPRTTPAHIGYEIQIADDGDEANPTGSVYSIVAAKSGLQRRAAWNSLDIESRTDGIRVKVNGQLAAETPGDPKRSKTGPIGLQLHDQFSFVLFRDIRIREVKSAQPSR